LGNFIMLMVIGLLFLIPHQTALSLGFPLLAIAIYSAYRSADRLWKQYKHVDNTPYLYWRFITSLICSLILIGFAEDLLRQEAVTFFWVTAVVIIFLISACSDAWFLLMEIPRDSVRPVAKSTTVAASLSTARKKA
jgi:undecaprenyl pyrophosphate phosphatase UppP